MKPNQEHAQKERDIFASNFRRILKMRGKTQSDIVSDLEITSSTVSDWANAKKYPRVDKMQALADYLGVVISDLREAKEKPAPVIEGGLHETMYHKLTPENQEFVKSLIEKLLKSQSGD